MTDFVEETRPLERPAAPCPHCGGTQFTQWTDSRDSTRLAVSCESCGAVLSSTHPLDPDDRPVRMPASPGPGKARGGRGVPPSQRKQRQHNYLPKLEEFMRTHNLAPGKVSLVDVAHDGWCAIYKGGLCNCDPEIRFKGEA